MLTDDGYLLAAYVDGPDDAPATVVLAHGWAVSAQAWGRVTGRLAARGLRVVRWDQRDHGRSRAVVRRRGRTASPPTVGRLGLDMGAVVDALAARGPLVLGGHSMGGMTTMALAGQRPDLVRERVRGVALVSTAADQVVPRPSLSPRDLPLRVARPVMRTLAAAPRPVRLPPSPAYRTRRRLVGPGASPELVDEVRRLGAGVRARAVGAWFAALTTHDEREALAHLAEVRVAVLVGDCDRLTPPHQSQRLVEALPHAWLDVVPGAGHVLPVERPGLVADRLASMASVGRKGAQGGDAT